MLAQTHHPVFAITLLSDTYRRFQVLSPSLWAEDMRIRFETRDFLGRPDTGTIPSPFCSSRAGKISMGCGSPQCCVLSTISLPVISQFLGRPLIDPWFVTIYDRFYVDSIGQNEIINQLFEFEDMVDVRGLIDKRHACDCTGQRQFRIGSLDVIGALVPCHVVKSLKRVIYDLPGFAVSTGCHCFYRQPIGDVSRICGMGFGINRTADRTVFIYIKYRYR